MPARERGRERDSHTQNLFYLYIHSRLRFIQYRRGIANGRQYRFRPSSLHKQRFAYFRLRRERRAKLPRYDYLFRYQFF